MPRQTPEQLAAFKALCRANELDPVADVWQQKQSGQWIIGRTGIEKIQARNNIAVTLDVVGFAIDYAGVKATATRSVKAEGSKTAKKLVVESTGSANPKNCTQISYYLEMAEKRAKGRAILMLMGFSALGIYGEDEAEAFQRPAEAAHLPYTGPKEQTANEAQAEAAGNVGGGSPMASEPPVMRAVSNSAAPVASAGAEVSKPADTSGPMLKMQREEIEKALTDGYLTETEATGLREGYPSFTAEQASKAIKKLGRLREQRATAPAPAAPVTPAPAPAAGNLKEAGTDSALVDDFVANPALAGVPFTPATAEQKETIIRLLNLDPITRKEKTALLVNINRLDTERARQAIVKLRATIEQREGTNLVKDLRNALHSKVTQYPEQLGSERVDEYLALVEDATATVDNLRAALAEANDCLNNNDHGYGTDEELAAADAIAA